MNKKIFTKSLFMSAALVLSATTFGITSLAAGTSSTVTGGQLSGGSVNFTPLNLSLDGTQQETTADWALGDITDARGLGTGWSFGLTLTPFKEVDAQGTYVPNGKTLAARSLKVTASPTISQVDSTSSATSTITPVAGTTALDTGSEVKILVAAQDGGMGSYSFGAMNVKLTVPANAYAKTYKTDATVTLNEAP